jgi:oxygen-independent coproporphyrinogen-3 oxidase
VDNVRPARPGLYIHVPFCQTKCPYCDFFSVTSPELISAYLEALEKEAPFYGDLFPAFDTLYLGGGTPSLLDGRQLDALMACLRRLFTFAPDTEVTIEANPDDLTPEKLALYKDLGVNRLSLGVQSFDDYELAFLGRRHTARQAEQALEWVRAAGYTNLGVDLIYGLPGQSAADWRQNLERVLQFSPEHLSCYQLTLEAGTPLGARQAQGLIKPLAEEAQRRLFLLTSRLLEENGYLHYEISNFARGAAFYSQHNRKYWQHTPYLGLGPGAHSFQGGKRWWNHRSLTRYCRALAAGAAPVAGSETLTTEQLRLESLYLGLRTANGVALDLIRRQPRWQEILSGLQAAGLVKVHQDRLIATRQGFLVADRLPVWLVD